MRALACHPESRPDGVRSVMADVRRLPAGVGVSYRIEGDLARVRVPAPRPPRAVPGLWRHTCCEIFVARKGIESYHEFNLSPSGEWAAHAFARYREGAMLDDASLDPGIEVRSDAEQLELHALIRLAGSGLLVGLAAVIEAADGALSYWALRHPAGTPDFHHRDAFALEL